MRSPLKLIRFTSPLQAPSLVRVQRTFVRSARLISGGDGLPGSRHRQLRRCGGAGSECAQCVPGPPPPPEQASLLFRPKGLERRHDKGSGLLLRPAPAGLAGTRLLCCFWLTVGRPQAESVWICQGTQWFSPLPSPANPTERIFHEERQPTPKGLVCAGSGCRTCRLLLPVPAQVLQG